MGGSSEVCGCQGRLDESMWDGSFCGGVGGAPFSCCSGEGEAAGGARELALGVV